MTLGIISIVIGCIWYFNFFSSLLERGTHIAIIDVNIAIVGSIFIVGGMILLKMNKNIENQNELLKQLLRKNPLDEIGETQFSVTHKVNLITDSQGLNLRSKPDSSLEGFIKIPNGTEVQVLEVGEKAMLNNKMGNWCKIRTKENEAGWCFSGSLIKI